MFEVREIIARCKDFLITLLPERKYDGDVYVLSGSGTVTHDMQPGSHEA
ncbi:hypothetical protein SDC9_138642 [bioreactor metagenome]|uniref:Uncharacterized protein n=1 Tax=bioreactor metagenome TaxID=1076179 RepID=A0A645DQD6_9ZZZZ